jgi:hypothetical protein
VKSVFLEFKWPSGFIKTEGRWEHRYKTLDEKKRSAVGFVTKQTKIGD